MTPFISIFFIKFSISALGLQFPAQYSAVEAALAIDTALNRYVLPTGCVGRYLPFVCVLPCLCVPLGSSQLYNTLFPIKCV